LDAAFLNKNVATGVLFTLLQQFVQYEAGMYSKPKKSQKDFVFNVAI
jgi:hypothetical protein